MYFQMFIILTEKINGTALQWVVSSVQPICVEAVFLLTFFFFDFCLYVNIVSMSHVLLFKPREAFLKQ